MTSPSTTGRILSIAGALGVAAGTLYYGSILRQSQAVAAASPMETVRALIVAALIANASGILLMFGLAALRDRVSLRLAGAALAILLVVLDYKVLDAYLGRVSGYALAGLIGAAFLLTPWLVKER